MAIQSDSTHLARAIAEKLSQRGATGTGADWVVRAAHPAGGHPSHGMPDDASQPAARPTYTITHTITAEAGTTEPWDCLLWSTPGDIRGALIARGPAGTNFLTDTIGRPYEVRFVDPVVGTGKADRIDNPLPVPDTVKVARSPLGVREFRREYASITAYSVSSTLIDQGTVHAIQYPPSYSRPRPGFTTLTDGRYAGLNVLTDAPFDESTFQMLSTKPYTNKASLGVYVPLRMRPGASKFVSADGISGESIQHGDPPVLYATDISRNVGVALVPRNMRTGLPVPWAYTNPIDTGYDESNMCVILFRGLDPKASIMFKAVVGLELTVDDTSSLKPFIAPPAINDQLAATVYRELIRELNDAYPASYNSLGAILPLIGSVLSKVAPVVGKFLAPAVAAAGPAIVARMAGTSNVAPRNQPQTVTVVQRRRQQPAQRRKASRTPRPRKQVTFQPKRR